MGVRIIEGLYDGTISGAVLLCSTTEWAFGPLFDNTQEASLFLDWCAENFNESVREMPDNLLKDRFGQFRKLVTKCADCDEWMIGSAKLCDDCKGVRA